MARIRTIKPEFWVDDVMVELPYETRLLFIGLWNFVDDEGYIEDKPRRIKMMIFPADDALIEDSLSALCDSGRLHAFDSDQGPLLQVANWARHQKINRPTPTRFTGITPKNGRDSVSTHAPLTDRSRGKGKEGKGREGIESTSYSPAPAVRVSESDFEKAWVHWPKKVERKKSFEKFKAKAKVRGVEQLAADIERFGRAYAQTTERRYVPALSVWLHGERWTDELPTASDEVVNAQWAVALGEHRPDPCAGGHRWAVDGSCVRCLTHRQGGGSDS